MNWREYPMARLLFPLAVGIGLGAWTACAIPMAMAGGLALFFIAMVLFYRGQRSYATRWRYGVALNLFLFTFGFLSAQFNDERRHPLHFAAGMTAGQKMVFIGTIQELQAGGRRLRLVLRVRAIAGEAEHGRAASGQLLGYLDIDAESRILAVGDEIAFRAVARPASPPLNPRAFDYRQYLHFQNIHYQVFIPPGAWKPAGRRKSLKSLAARCRQYCLRALGRHLPTENEYAVGAALILGHRAGLTEDIRNAYAHTGAMHVLAVSGLHVGLVQLLITFLLGRLPLAGNVWKYFRLVVVLLSIWSFALLTGASPSVLRAATMFSFLSVGQVLRRHVNIYNTLAASAFSLLCIDPYLFFSAGFQLSYLAVLGIIYFQPRIYRLWHVDNKLGDYCWKLMAVSLAAQASTFPISLYYFHQFPAYFWLSGMVVVPAAAFVLAGGLALFALQGIPWLSLVVGKLLYGLIWLVNALIFLIQQLPGSHWEGLWLSFGSMVFLYLFILSVIAAVQSRRFAWLLGALALLLALALARLARHWQARQQRVLAVYHIHRATAIDLLEGGNATLLCSDSLPEKPLRYAAQQHRWYRRVKPVGALHLESDGGGKGWWFRKGFLQFGSYRLAVVQDGRVLQGQGRISVDAVLLCQNPKASLAELLDKLAFQQVVIDGSNSRRKAAQWQSECTELGIPCHYTGEDGAWLIEE